MLRLEIFKELSRNIFDLKEWSLSFATEFMDLAQTWCLNVEDLYNKTEVHFINTSTGDAADFGIFSDNSQTTVFEFLEAVELAYLGWGNSVQKANRLYNKHDLWVREMTVTDLDFKNPVGIEMFNCFKKVCIIERNTNKSSRSEPTPRENPTIVVKKPAKSSQKVQQIEG